MLQKVTDIDRAVTNLRSGTVLQGDVTHPQDIIEIKEKLISADNSIRDNLKSGKTALTGGTSHTTVRALSHTAVLIKVITSNFLF